MKLSHFNFNLPHSPVSKKPTREIHKLAILGRGSGNIHVATVTAAEIRPPPPVVWGKK